MFEQQKELSLLLRGMLRPNTNQGLVISSTETSTTEEGQLSSLASQVNHLPCSDTAGDSTRVAGPGS
jgi:hypothetical protein